MMRIQLHKTLLASAISLAGSTLSMADDTVIGTGTTSTEQQSLGGTDHLSVASGATLSVDDTAVKWNSASTGLVIDNHGLIESTADGGRAINAGGSATAPRSITLNNYAGATIESQSDAFRINTDVTDGTIVVDNAGTISSTVDGQALDFDAIDSSGATISITNEATGIIESADADAIRPGENGTVYNYGSIYVQGVTGASDDGIDFQSHSGTVYNYAGATISGQRHGITTDTDVTVYNYGTIIGRNGSGVGSDGNGKVVNYGTILGEYDGSGTGDGDGVDIDYRGEVDNYGAIEGTGAAGTKDDGRGNSSEGVTITNGGYVYNHADGYISGVAVGVTGGGAMTITNEGTIVGGDYGIWYAGPGSYGGDLTIINSGRITGGDYAINFETSSGTLVIEKGSTITGLVDGGSGYSTIYLEGGAIFDSSQNFSALQVDGNAIVTGQNDIPLTTIVSGARLQLGDGGTSGFVEGAITDDGTLAIDRSDTVTLDQTITGSGGLEQAGSGTTVVAGDESYTGATNVLAGTLQAAAADAFSSVSTFSVASGATLDTAGYTQHLASLNNAGTVSLADGATGSQLVVDGAYTGGGGTLVLDANLEQGTSDTLVLNGSRASASGNTVLKFNILGGHGKATTGNGIEVVSTLDGATTTRGAFSLANGSLYSGAYQYKLYEARNDSWYLRSSYRNAVPTYMAIAGFAQELSQIGSMHERTGGSLRNSDDSRTWVRVSGRTGERDAGDFDHYGSSYHYNTASLQAGVDVVSRGSRPGDGTEASGDQAGLYLTAAHGNGWVDSTDASSARAGQLDGRAYSLGLYWTHTFASGLYLDTVLQGTRYNHIDAETSDEDGHLSLNGKGYTASLEAGYPLQLSAHTVLEPEAQLIGSQTHMGNGADQNSTIRFNHPWQYTGRLGARLEYTPGDTYALWAQASAWARRSPSTQAFPYSSPWPAAGASAPSPAMWGSSTASDLAGSLPPQAKRPASLPAFSFVHARLFVTQAH